MHWLLASVPIQTCAAGKYGALACDSIMLVASGKATSFVTPEVARTKCTLARPDSEDNQKLVAAAAKTGGTALVWLGGAFNTNTKVWEWDDGIPIAGYTNWEDESNGVAIGEAKPWLCMRTSTGKWEPCGAGACPAAGAGSSETKCSNPATPGACRYYTGDVLRGSSAMSTCSEWCSAKGLTCIGMYDEVENSCSQKGSDVGCGFKGDVGDTDWICECKPPEVKYDAACVSDAGCTRGPTTPDCSGSCAVGYYCPEGSTSSSPFKCQAGHAATAGGGDTIAACDGKCGAGYFCPAGSVSKTANICPAGTYGAYGGITSSLCSGKCPEGNFCTAGSQFPNRNPCTSPTHFCPAGAASETPVSPGHYTVMNDDVIGVSFVVSESTNKYIMVGIGAKSSDHAGIYRQTKHGILLRSDQRLQIYESGTRKYESPNSDKFQLGDVMEIRYTEDGASYSKNGIVFYKSIVLPVKNRKPPTPLYAEFVMHHTWSFLTKVSWISKPNSQGLWCLDAAVREHGDKVRAIRPALVKGSWADKPSGCLVHSGADWAAYFNTATNGAANSEFTPVNWFIEFSDIHTDIRQRDATQGDFCKQAAAAKYPTNTGRNAKLGSNFGRYDTVRSSWDHIPKGCSFYKGDGRAFWNSRTPTRALDKNFLPVDAITGYDTRSATAGSFVRFQGGGWNAGGSQMANGMYVAQIRCPFGNYCANGIKHPCPAGSVGSTFGDALTTASCSGKCPAGFCCPAGSTGGLQCGDAKCSKLNALLRSSESWFESKNAGAKWVSTTGSYTATDTKGPRPTVVTEKGNGATVDVKYLKGTFESKYSFGAILRPEYSICTLSRYTGEKRKRIITDYRAGNGNGYTGSGKNWIHGHHNGNRGVAHYDTWFTSSRNVGNRDDWLVMCASNIGPLAYRDGTEASTKNDWNTPNTHMAYEPCINCYGNEYSDWGVAEVITWARPLLHDEFMEVSSYLQGLLTTGTNSRAIAPPPGLVYCPVGSKHATLAKNGYYTACDSDSVGLEPKFASCSTGTRTKEMSCLLGRKCELGKDIALPSSLHESFPPAPFVVCAQTLAVPSLYSLAITTPNAFSRT